jgi:hypothetical protein
VYRDGPGRPASNWSGTRGGYERYPTDRVDVDVVEDYGRRLAAELEQRLLDVPRGGLPMTPYHETFSTTIYPPYSSAKG